jgi:tRNA(adenine34) deaminase
MDDESYMKQALLEAQKAEKEGEVPVGAIVVYDNRIVGVGHNQREAKKDISSHAEIEAIKAAEQTLGSWRLPHCTLYVTLEPCLMCASAIAQAGIARLVYGASDLQEGAICSHHYIYEDPAVGPRPFAARAFWRASVRVCCSLSLRRKERKRFYNLNIYKNLRYKLSFLSASKKSRK